MANTTYKMFKSLDDTYEHLTFIADVEAASPPAAVRFYYGHDGAGDGHEVPKQLALITKSSFHPCPTAVETQTRLKIG